jgi:long-chain fatty acid transport protein
MPRPHNKGPSRATPIALAAWVFSLPVFAANGLNVVGFGLESASMGGTDVAVARDGNAANTNPAGLAQVRGQHLEISAGSAFALDMGHADRLGNDLKVDNDRLDLANFAYATRLNENLVAGFGAFAQAGLGAEYGSLNSPFGGRDKLELLMGVGRLAAGLGWQIDPQWSIGASLSLNYAVMKQEILPGASRVDPVNPAASFFGSSAEDLTALRLGFRGGVQYRPSDTLTLGLAYGAKSTLRFSGDMRFNMSATGLGEVRYRDATISGFALPEEIALGAAWQATPALLVAAEVTWLHWSDAMEEQRIVARRPGSPFAPPTVRTVQQLDWNNQYVYTLGMHYRWSDRLELYGGFNYGAAPSPSRTLSPVLLTVGEKHLTAGFRYRIDKEWYFGGGCEYQVPEEVRYNNRQLPFGPSGARSEYFGMMLGFAREW